VNDERCGLIAWFSLEKRRGEESIQAGHKLKWVRSEEMLWSEVKCDDDE